MMPSKSLSPKAHTAPYLNTSVSLLWVFCLASAFAAQSQDHDAIEEIVVEGQYLYNNQVNALRTPTPIIDVPQSLSIVTADQIQQQGFTTIGDIINYVPGVNNSQGEGHRDAIVFRGVRSTADFFIDGSRDDVQYYRPLYNLAQVEVLRGPNALLFGRGGTGGVLNRVTKKALLAEQFTDLQSAVNSLGEANIQVDSNLDLSDRSAIRINAFYEKLQNHRDFFEGERIGINPTAKFELRPGTVLDLSYEYVDHQRFIDRGIPTDDNGRPVEALQDVVFADPELNQNALRAHLLRAAIQHEFTDSLKANFSAFHGDYSKRYENFYVASYDSFQSPSQVTLDGYLDTTERSNTILTGNFIWQPETAVLRHTIIVGAERIDTSSDQDRYNAFWSTTSDDTEVFSVSRPLMLHSGVGMNAFGVATVNRFDRDINDDTRVGIDVSSVYLQDEIELSETLDLVIGGRYDNFAIDVVNMVANETRTRRDTKVSPRGGLVFKPAENVSLYASYSESFLPRSGEQFANINGSNNQLDPNTFTNVEGGLKWDFRPGLSLTAAFFEITQSSPQIADNNPETLDVIDSEISGFEAQLQGQLTDDWTVSAGYSSLTGEQVGRSGPTGLRPRELPEHMFSLWNKLQVSSRLALGFGVTHQGESFINNANTAVLPSYTRLDVAAFYEFSADFRVQINIENATDELYFPYAHSTHQVTVAPPLHARVSISRRF